MIIIEENDETDNCDNDEKLNKSHSEWNERKFNEKKNKNKQTNVEMDPINHRR